jgi:hypothetical protein
VVFVESAVVGFAEVLQTIPLTVTVDPPSELMVPPLEADVCVMPETALVETVGAAAAAVQEFEVWLQVPLVQVKLQAPVYPAEQEPEVPPEAVAESEQPLMVVALHDDGAFTLTVTDWSEDVPPGPVHWKVKVVADVSGFVRPLPFRVPEFDHGPPAVQEVA